MNNDIVYVAIAYRYGYYNGSNYLVYATTNFGSCLERAMSERERCGGKYGVAIYAIEGEVKRPCHYVSSQLGEEEPTHNERIDLAEEIGLRVLGAIDRGKKVPSWLMVDQIPSEEE